MTTVLTCFNNSLQTSQWLDYIQWISTTKWIYWFVK